PFMYLKSSHNLLLITLLPSLTLAQTPGAFDLYLDAQCSSSSERGPFTTYPNVGLIVSGARGVSSYFSPQCASLQKAQLLTYRDTSCSGEPDDLDVEYLGFQTDCYSNGEGGIGAIQFGCGHAGGGDVATTTQRIRVESRTIASTAADATSDALGTGSGRSSPDDNDDDAFTSSRMATPSPVSNDNQGNASDSGGLSSEAKIGLGTGISIPIVALIVAVLAWRFPRGRKKVIGR
ncbi:MAG: hypothetical protein Q9174_005401, partial [Haloplaca sp. 1 TL-2023]